MCRHLLINRQPFQIHNNEKVLKFLYKTSSFWPVYISLSLVLIQSLFIQRIIKGMPRFTLSTPSPNANSFSKSFCFSSSAFAFFCIKFPSSFSFGSSYIFNVSITNESYCCSNNKIGCLISSVSLVLLKAILSCVRL